MLGKFSLHPRFVHAHQAWKAPVTLKEAFAILLTADAVLKNDSNLSKYPKIQFAEGQIDIKGEFNERGYIADLNAFHTDPRVVNMVKQEANLSQLERDMARPPQWYLAEIEKIQQRHRGVSQLHQAFAMGISQYMGQSDHPSWNGPIRTPGYSGEVLFVFPHKDGTCHEVKKYRHSGSDPILKPEELFNVPKNDSWKEQPPPKTIQNDTLLEGLAHDYANIKVSLWSSPTKEQMALKQKIKKEILGIRQNHRLRKSVDALLNGYPHP